MMKLSTGILLKQAVIIPGEAVRRDDELERLTLDNYLDRRWAGGDLNHCTNVEVDVRK